MGALKSLSSDSCRIRVSCEIQLFDGKRNTLERNKLTQSNSVLSCRILFRSDLLESTFNSDYCLENITSRIGIYLPSEFGSSIFSITLFDPILRKV